MTWKELCERAKDIGYSLEGDDDTLYQYGPHETGLFFRENGDIDFAMKTIINSRTPEQMWQIMQALEDVND